MTEIWVERNKKHRVNDDIFMRAIDSNYSMKWKESSFYSNNHTYSVYHDLNRTTHTKWLLITQTNEMKTNWVKTSFKNTCKLSEIIIKEWKKTKKKI